MPAQEEIAVDPRIGEEGALAGGGDPEQRPGAAEPIGITEGGLGYFKPGDGKELGGVFEIHASITFAYVFDNEARLGLTYSHISNADTQDKNPALDSILITYAFPIGPIL